MIKESHCPEFIICRGDNMHTTLLVKAKSDKTYKRTINPEGIQKREPGIYPGVTYLVTIKFGVTRVRGRLREAYNSSHLPHPNQNQSINQSK